MGVKVTIGGTPYQAQSFTSRENGTPLSIADSTGAVGDFTVVLAGEQHPILRGMVARITDSVNGTTLGKVSLVSTAAGLTTIDCVSRLGDANVYNVRAKPYRGTLRGAFIYYLGLAGVGNNIVVDDAIGARPVALVGWYGEVWFHLKQLAAAHLVEIALVGDDITMRPVRQREARPRMEISRTAAQASPNLARNVEIYLYETAAIDRALVYPVDGWENADTITVSAGQVLEQRIELGASVDSIQLPTIQETVTPEHSTSSVFTVSGDDGRPIKPAAWRDAGGHLAVAINDDTTSLTLTIVAPRGLPRADGTGEISTYSLSMSSGESERYPSLRIVGTGVAFRKTKHDFPTGVPASRTGQEVGITVDNPFVTSLDLLYPAARRLAKQYGGRRTGLTGVLKSFGAVGETNPQIYGNVAGARIWDEKSRRAYRVRTAAISPAGIEHTSDDDLTYADFQARMPAKTYAQMKSTVGGSYEKATLGGVPRD